MIHNTPQFHQIITWYDLVEKAMEQAGYQGNEAVGQYLVMTLDHFTKENDLASAVIALDFLMAFNSLGREGGGKMRQVGDECLLLAGLFPERAARKHVSVDYFIGMGQEAYHILTHPTFKWLYDTTLFAKLSQDFPHLIDVLRALRKV
jgi:hypothetical protein